jgi:hypothetical protein
MSIGSAIYKFAFSDAAFSTYSFSDCGGSESKNEAPNAIPNTKADRATDIDTDELANVFIAHAMAAQSSKLVELLCFQRRHEQYDSFEIDLFRA